VEGIGSCKGQENLLPVSAFGGIRAANFSGEIFLPAMCAFA